MTIIIFNLKKFIINFFFRAKELHEFSMLSSKKKIKTFSGFTQIFYFYNQSEEKALV